MYDNANKLPVLVTSDTLSQLSIITDVSNVSKPEFSVYPNPAANGMFYIGLKGGNTGTAKVWTSTGKLFHEQVISGNTPIELNVESGVYLLELESNGIRSVNRILVTE